MDIHGIGIGIGVGVGVGVGQVIYTLLKQIAGSGVARASNLNLFGECKGTRMI